MIDANLSYKSPDATVKMLISALFCIDTDFSVLTTDFKAEDILHRGMTSFARQPHDVDSP